MRKQLLVISFLSCTLIGCNMGGTIANNAQDSAKVTSHCEQNICQYPTNNSINLDYHVNTIDFKAPSAYQINIANISITENGQQIPNYGILVSQVDFNKHNTIDYSLTINLQPNSNYVITYNGITTIDTNTPIPNVSYKFSTK